MKYSKRYLILRNGTFVHSKTIKQLQFVRFKTIIVDRQNGKITKIVAKQDKDIDLLEYQDNADIRQIKPTEIIMPGFIDTHIHAPQFTYMGTGFDLSLYDWLNKYAFPCEARFKDNQHAKNVYQKCVNASLKNGTTTICYFGTIHLQACQILGDILHQKGMRGYVGKVCMDQNSPNFYIQSSLQSLSQSQQLIDYFRKKQYPKVQAILTPRFAPTCSRDLMKGLSDLSSSKKVPIQTHLSEMKSEAGWIKQLYPECGSYTQVYQKYGILKNNTILAHCIHLTDNQMKILLKSGAGISHCPNSNINVLKGIMPLRKLLNLGAKVGLGTDIAGGYSISMLNTIREVMQTSKLYNALIDQSYEPMMLAQAFYLAIVGGAQILHIEKQVGKFEIGMQFDAIVTDYSQLEVWIEEKDKNDEWYHETFQKMMYIMDDRHINTVYLGGKQGHSK